MDTRKIILEGVVTHYIHSPSPIGSAQLKEMLEIDVSAATIRNHFRRLVDEGYLAQLHSSSGRVPTAEALKSYWQETLSNLGTVAVRSLETLRAGARKFGLFVSVVSSGSNRMTEIVNVGDRYLIAVFEEGEVLFPYSTPVFRFLREFSGYDAADLYKIAVQNGIDELTLPLRKFLSSDERTSLNRRELVRLANEAPEWSRMFFDGYYEATLQRELENGIYFDTVVPQGAMLMKMDAVVAGKPANLACLGDLSRDFGTFVNQVKE